MDVYNQSLNDYHDLMQFCPYLSLAHYISAGLTIFLYPATLYIVVTKSPKENPGLKWLFTNMITTSLILVLVNFMFQPVLLPPYLAMFGLGLPIHLMAFIGVRIIILL